MAAVNDESEAEIQALLEQLHLSQKIQLISGADYWRTCAQPKIGLRQLVLSDGPVGVRGQTRDERDPSVCLPSATAMAATWDEVLVGRLAELLAAEAHRKGVHVLLGPTLNLHRSPLGGRHFECFSEDPLLTGRIGAAYVRALQSFGIAACPKHYVANDSETDRFIVDIQVDDRTLRELYLLPFEHAVFAGAWMVMSAYNGVNGQTMTEHPLLEDPLKGEWGFDGVIVSDWLAVRSTDEAGRAGNDLAMPGPSAVWGSPLLDAVRKGRVSQAAIDDKVRRILRLASRVGALDTVEPPSAKTPEPGDPISLLREAAARAMVLLRNEGALLPLDAASLRRLAVIGLNASAPQIQGGGSSHVTAATTVSPIDGIRAALGNAVEVLHEIGAYPEAGLPPASLHLLINPVNNEPGMHVQFLDANGSEIKIEDRRAAQLTAGKEDLIGVDTVVLHTRLRARADGLHHLGISGSGPCRIPGRYRLEVARMVLADEIVEPSAGGGQPFDFTHAPPRDSTIMLAPGEEVDVVLTHQPSPGAEAITLTLGLREPTPPFDLALARAVAAARDADVAVVVVGSTADTESEGYDRLSLRLHGRQDELVRAVAAANPRTVVVVNSGAPVEIPWHTDVPAVLISWLPGQEFGNALADVLLGAREPGGRLPTTWPVRQIDLPVWQVSPREGILDYTEGLHIGYRAWARSARSPGYPFGHGLGYVTWDYRSMKVADEIPQDEPTTVYVRLVNTGDRTGKEVVQLYLQRCASIVERPALWLAGFGQSTAAPNEEIEIGIELPARAFQYWSAASHAWCTEPGKYVVFAARSATELLLRDEIIVADNARVSGDKFYSRLGLERL